MDTTDTSQSFGQIVSLVSNIITAFVGIIVIVAGIWGFSKGGFRFIKVVKKINKFVDRVDCLIDDFWPEILSGLEKKGFLTTGMSARWTSTQAKILKSQSPIQITDYGYEIIENINFNKIYSENSELFDDLVKKKLGETQEVSEYDIEQASLKTMNELFDQSHHLIKNAENYLFEHPKLASSQLKSLLGIFLRDKILDDPNKRTVFGLTPTKDNKSS